MGVNSFDVGIQKTADDAPRVAPLEARDSGCLYLRFLIFKYFIIVPNTKLFDSSHISIIIIISIMTNYL